MGFKNIDTKEFKDWIQPYYFNFDSELPDPVILPDTCSVHYNIHKIALHHWDQFNQSGHGAINHHFGNIDNDFEIGSYYYPFASKMTRDEWANCKIMLIVNCLGYQYDLKAPFEYTASETDQGSPEKEV